MDPVVTFLIKQLLDKLLGDNMAINDYDAYYNQLAPVYAEAVRLGISLNDLTKAIRQADSGNGVLAEAVVALREGLK